MIFRLGHSWLIANEISEARAQLDQEQETTPMALTFRGRRALHTHEQRRRRRRRRRLPGAGSPWWLRHRASGTDATLTRAAGRQLPSQKSIPDIVTPCVQLGRGDECGRDFVTALSSLAPSGRRRMSSPTVHGRRRSGWSRAPTMTSTWLRWYWLDCRGWPTVAARRRRSIFAAGVR